MKGWDIMTSLPGVAALSALAGLLAALASAPHAPHAPGGEPSAMRPHRWLSTDALTRDLAKAAIDEGVAAVINPVAPSTPAALPAPTDGQVDDALAAWRSVRASAGLPDFAHNPNLALAARSHSAYLASNTYEGHTETPGLPGFTGEDPCKRMAAAGYTDRCVGEVVAGHFSAREAALTLIDAPFHRFLMLSPAYEEAGLGAASGSLFVFETIDFGRFRASESFNTNLIVFPYPGQSAVSTSWLASETPQPLPDLAGRLAGYPVTIQSRLGSRLEISWISVKGPTGARVHGRSIRDVPEYRVALTNEFLWIPMRPLSPNTAYTVEAVGALNGRAVVLNWRFSTGA